MVRRLVAMIGVAVLILIAAMILSLSIPGEGALQLSYSDWAEVCIGAPDFAPCLQHNMQLIDDSLRSALERLRFFWHSYTVATMGGGIILVVLMLVLQHRPLITSFIGAFVFLALISGIYVLAERDWQTTASIVVQVGQLIFLALTAVALIAGSLMLFGTTLRLRRTRNLTDKFVIRTAHSTSFPQTQEQIEKGLSPDMRAPEMVGDIDGVTGSIRVSNTCSNKLKAAGMQKGNLVRISWKDRPNGQHSARFLYRRLRIYKSISTPSSPPFAFVGFEYKPKLAKSEFPLCILHFEDKGKLFGDEGLQLSASEREASGLRRNDNRDLAELTIERAYFWDWFYYVFNHTDPAVAWSFRMGIVVSIVLMVTQITILEPILSAGRIALD
ncbi:hypothetical protein [uncultured Parvibaculum sp.]|uniref:hypothetical protein n=1 Tax=uncultured Parvibaculum sp. TaxID=291828 RepID=UPI0030DB2FCB|tara:strand:- start:120647 stop:121801 length:1155 start_codon:yes stop_codon:yes gene_type:complete